MANYPVPKPDAGSDAAPMLRQHTRELASTAAGAMSGKINAVTSFTCTANAATSTFTDYRLTVNSFVDFDPVTANAAAEKAAGTLYVLTANRANGAWTVTHANAATTNRTFRVLIIG